MADHTLQNTMALSLCYMPVCDAGESKSDSPSVTVLIELGLNASPENSNRGLSASMART